MATDSQFTPLSLQSSLRELCVEAKGQCRSFFLISIAAQYHIQTSMWPILSAPSNMIMEDAPAKMWLGLYRTNSFIRDMYLLYWAGPLTVYSHWPEYRPILWWRYVLTFRKFCTWLDFGAQMAEDRVTSRSESIMLLEEEAKLDNITQEYK